MSTNLRLPFSLLICINIFFSGCTGYNTITKSSLVPNVTIIKRDFPRKGWKKMPIYEDDDIILTRYKVLAEITIIGKESDYDKQLIRKMKKEAGRYHADAIIFKGWREVDRTSVNYFAATMNIISIFSDDEPLDLDMGGNYTAFEYKGIAIKYLNKRE